MSLKIAIPGFAAIAIGKIHRERFTESQNDQRNNSMMDAEHIRYIRLYDLITRMRTALDDYIAFHNKPTMNGIVKAVHKYGTIRIRLTPKK